MNSISTGLAIALVFSAGSALAQEGDNGRAYGMAGCGLGSQLFNQNKAIDQILAATTNGSFGTQTFGITSGTSNCTQGGVAVEVKQQGAFFETNFREIQADAARGGGDYLAAMGALMGCDREVLPVVFETARRDFDQVFPNETIAPMDAFVSFKGSMKGRSELAEKCAAL
ncbi:MAG: DUF3015 family protein [Myxococcales bacterium]|nr:DUF3015 family protein [Myxococcales bacterium]